MEVIEKVEISRGMEFGQSIIILCLNNHIFKTKLAPEDHTH